MHQVISELDRLHAVNKSCTAGQEQLTTLNTAGLSVLSPPSLPADLNEGYPDSFIRKPAGDAVSVEVVVNAALHAGAELQGASVVTFRNVSLVCCACCQRSHAQVQLPAPLVVLSKFLCNLMYRPSVLPSTLQNLNKILGTPLDVRNGWSVDACYHQGTLYLDIVKNDSQEGPDADRFTYYGYKVSRMSATSFSKYDLHLLQHKCSLQLLISGF
jgi:hypothetical protein